MQHTDTRWALLSAGRAAALSVSLLALSGCISAVSENGIVDSQESRQEAASANADASQGEAGADDGEAAMLGAGEPPQQAADQLQATSDTTAMQQGLTMQSTALRAASSSIYGQAPSTIAAPAPGQAAQPNMNATSNSLFSGAQQPTEPVLLPQEAAPDESSMAVPAAAPSEAAEGNMLSAVPVPLSAKAALAGETSRPLQPVAVASAEQVLPPEVRIAQTASSDEPREETKRTSKGWTFASLFVPKRREKPRGNGATGAQATPKKTITAANASDPQTASLAYNALPGVDKNPLFKMEHTDHLTEEDDAAVEVASLPGLARLAPNGLILQTKKVQTGCFKPALLEILKTVEQHYGQKVMVTSGLRAIKVNRKRQSFHTRCEAADIQVKGVSKWQLADYLRNLPGRGGVGTYCHTESVHIDVGPQRDWNWRCRRRKG